MRLIWLQPDLASFVLSHPPSQVMCVLMYAGWTVPLPLNLVVGLSVNIWKSFLLKDCLLDRKKVFLREFSDT